MTFDATGLNDGIYEGTVKINSNDPVTPLVSIPATFNVTGMPEIEVMPDSVVYGEVFVTEDSSFSEVRSIEIKNVGRKVLNVDSIALAGEAFAGSFATPFALQPQESQSFDVTFTPDTIGTFFGEILIQSDDPMNAVAAVSLTGEGVAPPVFTAMTEGDTIYARVKNQGSATDMITIGNVTGGSTLSYESNIVFLPGGFSAAPSPGIARESKIIATGGANKIMRSGSAPVVAARMSEELEFTDSLFYDPGNVADDFVGIDVDGITFAAATRFTLSSSQSFGLTHVRNFYRTEGSTDPIRLEVYRGGSNPSSGTLLTSQEYTGATDEGSFELITLNEPQNFTGGETFWVVIYYPVTTVFAQGVNDGVTGIDGLYFYSADDGFSWVPLENDLPGTAFKVRALQASSDGWITLNPESGEVAAGGTETINVALDGLGLEAGEYFARIDLSSNDPFNPSASIPVQFSINQLPEFFQAPTDTLYVDESDILEVVLRAGDRDGTILLYTLDEVYPNVTFNASTDSAVVRFAPDFDQSGFYTFTVAAFDDLIDRGETSFVVKVKDVNRIPAVVSQVGNKTYYEGGGQDIIDLSAYIQDPDLDVLQFTANAANPDLVGLEVEGKLLLITPLKKGKTFVSIIGDDGKGGQAGTSFKVNVKKANAAPVVAQPITDENMSSDEDVIYIDISTLFSDPDGDALVYTVTSSDESIATATVANDFIIVSQTGVGEVMFTITASDGKGGEAATDITLKVDQITSISDLAEQNQFALGNYPNPFSIETTIQYVLEQPAFVKLEIIAYNGSTVDILVEGKQDAGEQKVNYQPHYLPSGIYLYKLEVDGEVSVGRMMIE